MNSSTSPRSRFFWFAWYIAAFVLLLQLSTIGIVLTGRSRPTSLGVYWLPAGDGWVAASVEHSSTVHGRIKKGDQLVAIDGDVRAAYLGADPYRSRFRAGVPVRLSVVRAGEPLKLDVMPAAPSFPLWFLAQNIAFSLLTLLVGLASLQRPRSATARWMFACSVLVALIFCRQTLQMMVGAYVGSLERLAAFLIYSVYPLHFCAAYQFLSNFPVALPQTRLWYGVRGGVWAFGFTIWLEGLGHNAIWMMGLDLTRSQLLGATWVHFYDTLIARSQPMFSLITYSLMAVVLVRNYRALSSLAERRRIRLTALGLALIAAGLLLVGAMRNVAGPASPLFLLGEWVQPMLVALGPPLLAYAVLKDRVIGVRFAIRRGIQYLLALNFLRLLLLSPVLLLGAQAVTSPPESFGGFVRQTHWGTHVFVVVGAATSIYLRRRIQDWVDRKFFRTAYSQERLLLALIEQVKNADSITEISQMVAHQLDAALHPKSLYIFYRKHSGDGFSVGYPEDVRGTRAMQLLLDRRVFERLEGCDSKPFMLLPSETTPIDDPGQEAVLASETSLVVPMIGPDQHLAGALWLDEKMSEEPYSTRDQALLQTIAAQIGMVYENLQLKEQLQAEQRVRLSVMGRLDAQSMNLLKECLACGRCYDRTVEHCTMDGSPLSMTVPVDRVIDKKYRLDRRLGAGGMGAVYEALDLRLNRVVAIKVMVGRLFGNRAALRRFEREARTSARLSHPNIVTIHDFGRLEGDGAYLVMEYLKGRSWRNELMSRRVLPAAEVVPWFVQFCRAMTVAHAAGVVHRDLKPENLMVTPRPGAPPLITVLDFGLAKAREPESGERTLPNSASHLEQHSSLTATGVVMGTLRYMAPEQLAGQEADARSDIYAATLILVETILGALPQRMREMDTWIETALLNQAQLNPGWDYRPLAQALKRGLSRDCEQRYQTAADLERDILPALASAPAFRLGTQSDPNTEKHDVVADTTMTKTIGL